MHVWTKLSKTTVPVPTAPRYPEGHPEGPPAAADLAIDGRCRNGLGRVLLMMVLPAVDGGILLLAAAGRLSSPASAAAIGLTMIAGVGAWIAARDAFAVRPWTVRNGAALIVLGLVTVAATVAAAWIGTTLGQALTLHVLPKVAGVALCLIGAEVSGLRLPKPVGVPLPVVAVAAGVFLEVAYQWTP